MKPVFKLVPSALVLQTGAVLFSAALTAFPTSAGAKPPSFSPPSLPNPSASQIKHECERNLVRVKKELLRIESRPALANGSVLKEMNALNILVEDLSGPLYLLANVSPDKAVREASEECTVKWAPIETEIYQSEKLYRRIAKYVATNPLDSAYRQDLIFGFEDSGVTLPPTQRSRAKEINTKIVDLAKSFEKAIRDDVTKVRLKPEDLEGVPTGVFNNLKADADGFVSLGLEYPTYVPVMENAVRESTREAMWRAKVNEGGVSNLKLLDEITQLRREYASLYGYSSYAAYSLRRKMARSPDHVLRFLDQVKTAITELEQKEIEELRAFKSARLKTSLVDTKLHRWDISFFQEQLRRERFNVNQEELRKYFPTEASVQFILRLSEKLYGIQFKERQVQAWHSEVRVVDVYDTSTFKFIGSIYLDLFPRDGKYNHAAVWPIRNGSTLVGRTPIPALVVNLNRTGLDQNELETLLHEFGHALHGVLSTTVYNFHAGTGTLRDFVEAPSQMFEEWARRPEPLQFFAQICGACPVLSVDQIKALDQARKFGRGIQYARQWVYASFDMALTHDPKATNALEVWKKIEGSTPLGHVEGTYFPAGFSHLVGGYAAGYYGYMWSEVMALDMLSAFGGNLLSEDVGKRYRQSILSQGGQKPPHALVEAFLGRAANSDAFFKEIIGKR